MKTKQILIYGSYGYTGKLIVDRCLELGIHPVLAGRNAEKLARQAKEHSLTYRAFDLGDHQQTLAALEDCLVVVNCAGPFWQTFDNMINACLATKTHYLDITGEYLVIQKASERDEAAREAGIMILPGGGFDVVPSDCLAVYLKNKLPDATKLTLAIASLSSVPGAGIGISHGTAKTMLDGMAEGTMRRHNGVLQSIGKPESAVFTFSGSKERLCAAISWGDLASAWWSTKIPNIETWMSVPKQMIRFTRLIHPFKFIFNWKPIKRFLRNKINQLPEGPSLEARQHGRSEIVGIVRNNAGKEERALLTTLNGYALTAQSIGLIVQKILAGDVHPGFQTPATAYGHGLILEIPGSKIEND